LTGYELSEVIGKDLRVLRSYQHDKAFYKNLWQTPLSGQVWHGEIINKRKDGSLYTEEETIAPVRDAAGEIAHFIAIKQDITERKSAEESRRHLAAIVESSNDAIISANLGGIVTSWNAAAQRLFDYAPEEIVGRSLLVLIPPNRRSEALQLLKKVRAGERIHVETVRLKKRRIPVNVASTVSPVKNDAGQIIGTSAVIRDITERKELEQAVVEAGSREQRRIGHDLHDGLCQQLTGISLLWKAIAQSVDARALPEVAEVTEITQLIAKTIGEARDLARGLCPVELERNDLGVALKKLGLSMERLFAVSCVVRRQQPVVLADKTAATHLYRIAQEAISNAIHHGKAARVWVHLNWRKNRLTLRIRDNGSGFSKRRSFKEGIGIRSMKYRAQVIGGSLTIESKRGAGTTVACIYNQSRSQFAGVARSHKPL
jgi:two-component system, LuxR family, sensor kinase FixL